MIQKFLNWKTIGVIVIVVLLLSLLNKCNDTDSLRGELKQIKLQKEMAEKKFKEQKENHKILVDSLSSENKKEKEVIKKLREQNLNNEKQIAALKKNAKAEKEKLSKLDVFQMVDWFSIRYNDFVNVKSVDGGISFHSYLPKTIAGELIDKDFLKQENEFHLITIKNKDSEIESTNKILKNTQSENESNKSLLVTSEENEALSKKAIENLEEANKKERKKNTVKTVLTPIIAVGTFILGIIVGK